MQGPRHSKAKTLATTQPDTHTYAHTYPSQTHTLTHSDTPARVICAGRGTASDGVKR